jgi:hypothetical protein
MPKAKVEEGTGLLSAAQPSTLAAASSLIMDWD